MKLTPKKLPNQVQKTWEAAYNSAKGMYGKERASKIAWEIVKRKDHTSEKPVAMKNDITLTSEKLVCRSEEIGESSNDYFIEGYIATRNIAEDGMYFTEGLLKSIEEQIIKFPINLKGDLEHVGTKIKQGRKVTADLPTYDDFMKIVETKLDDNGLWIKTKLDKYADNFPRLWNKIQEGFYDAFSVEVLLDKNSMTNKIIGNRIIKEATKGKIKKFTLTGTPADKYARVTSAYKK